MGRHVAPEPEHGPSERDIARVRSGRVAASPRRGVRARLFFVDILLTDVVRLFVGKTSFRLAGCQPKTAVRVHGDPVGFPPGRLHRRHRHARPPHEARHRRAEPQVVARRRRLRQRRRRLHGHREGLHGGRQAGGQKRFFFFFFFFFVFFRRLRRRFVHVLERVQADRDGGPREPSKRLGHRRRGRAEDFRVVVYDGTIRVWFFAKRRRRGAARPEHHARQLNLHHGDDGFTPRVRCRVVFCWLSRLAFRPGVPAVAVPGDGDDRRRFAGDCERDARPRGVRAHSLLIHRELVSALRAVPLHGARGAAFPRRGDAERVARVLGVVGKHVRDGQGLVHGVVVGNVVVRGLRSERLVFFFAPRIRRVGLFVGGSERGRGQVGSVGPRVDGSLMTVRARTPSSRQVGSSTVPRDGARTRAR